MEPNFILIGKEAGSHWCQIHKENMEKIKILHWSSDKYNHKEEEVPANLEEYIKWLKSKLLEIPEEYRGSAKINIETSIEKDYSFGDQDSYSSNYTYSITYEKPYSMSKRKPKKRSEKKLKQFLLRTL
jgi:hypothetical protein